MKKRKKNELFIPRELSWLEFNQRVLDEARDPSVPALERLKFLAITAANLDEFFMVRVGGLQLLAREDPGRRDIAGLTPGLQLERIMARSRRMIADQYAGLEGEILPLLRGGGIELLRGLDLSEDDLDRLSVRFAEWSAVISPMAVKENLPFPLLANLGLHLAARLAPEPGGDGSVRHAIVPVGNALDRLVPLSSGPGARFVLLDEALQRMASLLFPGETILECAPFRVTRNADIGVREFLAPDLLTGMQEVLAARRTSDGVRLEVAAGMSSEMARFLLRGLEMPGDRLFEIPGPLALSSLMPLAAIEGYNELTYEPWPPQQPPGFDSRASIFETISRGELLLLHPYESFDPVLKLVEEAADDPAVLAIKQVLYRTSSESPIIAALKRAAENGKSVTAVLELKARFDEARNIEWAGELETAGVQVIHGVKGLKTHAKVCIVVRREPQGIVRYLHFGTGNYNERTARLYSDVSYLTRDEDLGADASAFFNAVTGYARPRPFLKLAAAPHGLRERFLELIDDEIQRKQKGQKAAVWAKMNALVDPVLIRKLYQASAAGVTVELNVRGICCLRPGVPGLSERIRVTSIIDRFLEHARIYCFHHGGHPLVFLSSADWMPRNLDRRVELLVPIEEASARQRLLAVMKTFAGDNVKGRRLAADGSFAPPSSRGRKRIRSQETLYREALAAAESHRGKSGAMFEPHRPAGRHGKPGAP